PMKITTWPKPDQWLLMSTVDRPVTQIVDTAVNSASLSGVTWRSAEAIGRDSRPVKSRIRAAKMTIAKREGEEVVRCLNRLTASLTEGRGEDADMMPDIEPPPAVRATTFAEPSSWYSVRSRGTRCPCGLP